MIVWYILILVFCVFLSCEYYAFRTGVPTVASFPSARRKIIEILQKDAASRPADQSYVIIDLGSGGGQLCSRIARALPRSTVTGIEISWAPWLRAVMRHALFGPANLAYKRINFWPYDISQADAVVSYLTENVIDRLSEKLRKELKPGALIIINDNRLSGDWEPAETVATGFLSFKVFVYRQK